MQQIKKRPSFAKIQDFGAAIKRIRTNYFKNGTTEEIVETGDWRLWHKAIILLTLFIFVFGVLIFTECSSWIKILLTVLLGAITASIGFNVGHDANHGSFSKSTRMNDFMSLSFNLFGIFSFFWRIKHNVLHHTYTNLNGFDEDISGVKQLRMHPDQTWKPVHRYQVLYCWFLYGLLHFGWVCFNDFKKYFQGHIEGREIQMEKKDRLTFWVTKIFYVSLFCVLPATILGFKTWIVGYVVYEFSVGLITSIVFQLAHVVEKTSQPTVLVASEEEWIAHEVATTANFGMNNKILSWFVGGLNFQIEHHLFPKVSHIHYPNLSIEVQKVCKTYDVSYHKYPTFWSALKSHVRKMAQLGRRPIKSLT